MQGTLERDVTCRVWGAAVQRVGDGGLENALQRIAPPAPGKQRATKSHERRVPRGRVFTPGLKVKVAANTDAVMLSVGQLVAWPSFNSLDVGHIKQFYTMQWTMSTSHLSAESFAVVTRMLAVLMEHLPAAVIQTVVR
ncbi:MAG: hypothetical protein FRX49_06737 [Trebouxia sp. A1-2]|nr:MAG: hypothetical protein FRX49_06737 [Trebouxia sp. A1-2]